MESEKITKAQRTKKNVLETAMALMGERGYYNTTIRDICDKAGVSIGTFYTYFPSKRDIFADIFGRADDIFETEVAKQVKGGTVCDRIVDYFRYYARLNLDSGIELMKVIYSAENTWFTKDRPMQKVLENLIAEGQKAGDGGLRVSVWAGDAGAGYSIWDDKGEVVESDDDWSGLVHRLESALPDGEKDLTVIWP